MSSLTEIFAPDGPLAQAISGYRVRGQQLDMAERIAAAIDGCSVFIAEAGTGTGKTFAYLVPALLSGGRVIVSTGTRTLQDQLFNRGPPTGRAALKIPRAAQIFAIIDVYDALTSDRPYRKSWPREKTLEHIRAPSGSQFNPHVVEEFMEMIGKGE